MKVRRKSTKSQSNIGRKFIIFVKPIDNEGMVIESKCGWFCFRDNIYQTCFLMKDAHVLIEKEDGHGSFKDWKKFLEAENPDWKIVNRPTYLDEIKS